MAAPFKDNAGAYQAIVLGFPEASPYRTAVRFLTGHAATLLPSAVLPLSLVAFLWHTVFLVLAPGRMALTDRGAVLALTPEHASTLAPWEWCLLAVAVALSVYAVAVAFTAGVRVAAAAAVGRSLSARTALGEAVRHPLPALVVLSVIAILTCAGAVAAVWGASATAGLGLSVLFLVVVVALVLLQLGTLAISRATGTVTALFRNSESLRQRLPACVARLFVVGIVAALVVVLVLWLRRALVAPGGDISLLLSGALQTLLLVGTASLALAFGAALLVVQALDATWERVEWAEKIHASLPAARPGRAAPSVVGALATVVVVSLALPLTVWALPEHTPVRYTLETVTVELPQDRHGQSSSRLDRRIDLRAVEDGHLVTMAGAEHALDSVESGPVLHCAPLCEEVVPANPDSVSEDHHLAGAGTGTRVLWERGDDTFDLNAYEGCAAGSCDGDVHTIHSEARPEGMVPYQNTLSALHSSVIDHEGRTYVFSLVHLRAERSVPESEVQVHVCGESGCSDAQTHALGTLPRQEGRPHFTTSSFLDGAVGPDGAPVASVYNPHDGSVQVLSCSGSECADTEIHTVASQVVTPQSDYAVRTGAGNQVHGARIEVRPDGTPVVAYRALEDGSSKLVDCADPFCAESVEQTLTGPDWRQHAPALALDSAGIPHLALSDRTTRTPTLLACADSGCSEWETAALHSVPGLWSDVGLALDEDDRPVLAALVQRSWVSVQDETNQEPEYSLAVYRCALPSCGLMG